MASPTGYAAGPEVTKRPSSSTSSYSQPKTRWSSGCCAAQTAAAAAPAREPRRVRVRLTAMLPTVTPPRDTVYAQARMNSPDRYHERARTRGVNPIVYWLTRALLQPFAHLYFRLSR